MTTAHHASRSTSTATGPLPAGRAPIRVVLVDDCTEVRFLLATLIELDGRFDVVAEASDTTRALRAVSATDPEVVLVDLRLGRRSGTAIIRALRRRGTTACIVVVTASAAARDHDAALAAGADAVQVKGSMTSTMIDELAELVERHRARPDINICTTARSDPPVRFQDDR